MARPHSSNRGPVDDGIKARRRKQWLSMLEDAYRMNVTFDKKQAVKHDVEATAQRAPRKIDTAPAAPVPAATAAGVMARLAAKSQAAA